MKKILYFMAGCIVFFASCKPDKGLVENTKYEKIAVGDPKYSYLKILNLSPNSPVVNFYLNGAKFSTKQSTTGIENAGYTYNQVFPDFGYAVATPGSQTLTGKVIPTATADPSLEVFSATINPAPGKYYTLVPSGLYDATTKKIPSFVTVEDTRPALDSTKIFIRLLNVISGGPSTTLIRGTTVADPKIISNVGVNTVSDWAEISSPGGGPTTTLGVLFIDAGTNTPIGSTVTFTGLTKGRAYTLYIRGIWGATGTNAPTLSFYTSFY
ncbi:DUF4397 domain-containing protein [Nubsella zeaxanthinifaciens]|uniref:DUF4397 domain-containing protein n=1 Tax=Nubsella zeaxanthinifaciens TaxID=392412 RepID=UPI003D03B389